MTIKMSVSQPLTSNQTVVFNFDQVLWSCLITKIVFALHKSSQMPTKYIQCQLVFIWYINRAYMFLNYVTSQVKPSWLFFRMSAHLPCLNSANFCFWRSVLIESRFCVPLMMQFRNEKSSWDAFVILMVVDSVVCVLWKVNHHLWQEVVICDCSWVVWVIIWQTWWGCAVSGVHLFRSCRWKRHLRAFKVIWQLFLHDSSYFCGQAVFNHYQAMV